MNTRRNLIVCKDRQTRRHAFSQAFNAQSKGRGAQENWSFALLPDFFDALPQAFEEIGGEFRFEGKLGGPFHFLQGIGENLFQSGVKGNNGKNPGFVDQCFADMPGKTLSNNFRQGVWFRYALAVGQRLENRDHIPDGNAFPQEVLQDFEERWMADDIRDDFFDNERICRFDTVEQCLKFLPAEERGIIVAQQRAVVDAIAAVLNEAFPDRIPPARLKPVTMALLGMLNFSFAWLRPDGPMSHEEFGELALSLSLHGLAGAPP